MILRSKPKNHKCSQKIYRNIHICISKFIYIQAYIYMYAYNAQISDLKKRNKTVSLISTNNKIINLYSVYIFFIHCILLIRTPQFKPTEKEIVRKKAFVVAAN